MQQRVSPVEIRPLGLTVGGAMAWRFRSQLQVTVVVKASFLRAPHGRMVLDEPDDNLHDDDLVPYRPFTEVLLAAPPGGPLRLIVFDEQATQLDKTGDPSAFQPLPPPPRLPLDASILQVPSDLDWAFFQTAPADQRISGLCSNTWIRIERLGEQAPLWELKLPSARAAGRVYGLTDNAAPAVPLDFRTDEIHLDAIRGRCTLTYRAHVAVPSETDLLGIVVLTGIELDGHPIRWPAAVPLMSQPSSALPPEQADHWHAPHKAPTVPALSSARPQRRQGTVLLEWSAPDASSSQASPPPPRLPQERQATELLVWATSDVAGALPRREEDEGSQGRSMVVSSSSADATRNDGPRMETRALSGESATLYHPMGAPFRLAEPGVPPWLPSEGIPGAPWARPRAPEVASLLPASESTQALSIPVKPSALAAPREVEPAAGTVSVAPRPVVAVVAAPADDEAPGVDQGVAEPPREQAVVVPPAASGRAWSWASVAEPVQAEVPTPVASMVRRPPLPAVNKALYGRFSPTKK